MIKQTWNIISDYIDTVNEMSEDEREKVDYMDF